MRTLLSSLILLILLAASCSDKKPAGLLPENDIRQLLQEVHLLDGYLQTLPIDSSQKVIDTLYRQLLAKYSLDSVAFERNIDYYYADPMRTEAMYTQLQEAFSEADRAINRADSIRYAAERDSMDVISRYQRLLDMQLNLMHHYPDSTYRFTMEGYKEQLYRASGLQFLWQRANFMEYPSSPQPLSPAPPAVPNRSNDQTVELDAGPEPVSVNETQTELP